MINDKKLVVGGRWLFACGCFLKRNRKHKKGKREREREIHGTCLIDDMS
jgi:hypothetical protein